MKPLEVKDFTAVELHEWKLWLAAIRLKHGIPLTAELEREWLNSSHAEHEDAYFCTG